MVRLVLTEDQQRMLDESDGIVEIVDRSGHVLMTIGHGLTQVDLLEIEQESDAFQPVGTLSELLGQLKASKVGL